MYCIVRVVRVHVLYCESGKSVYFLYCDSGKSVHVFIVTVLCVHVLYSDSITYTCIVL
jgi:hypothetical protein